MKSSKDDNCSSQQNAMNTAKDLLRGIQPESKNLFSDFIKKYDVIFPL
jgi:hypothetical protein